MPCNHERPVFGCSDCRTRAYGGWKCVKCRAWHPVGTHTCECGGKVYPDRPVWHCSRCGRPQSILKTDESHGNLCTKCEGAT